MTLWVIFDGFERALGMSALAPIATELLHDGNRREEPCGREQLQQILEANSWKRVCVYLREGCPFCSPCG